MTILIDCLALLRKFLCCDFLCDFQAMKEKICKYVQKWNSLGVKVICVVDGSVELSKLQTWLERRYRDLNKVRRFMKAVQNPDYILRESDWKPVTSTSYYMGQAFAFAGAEVIYTDVEADRVLVGLAQKKDVIGIISADSDFVIFDFPGFYIIADSLRFLFDRNGKCSGVGFKFIETEDLCKEFNMKKEHLKYIGCILGCDVIKPPRAEVERLTAKHNYSNFVQAAVCELHELLGTGKLQTLPKFKEVGEFYTPTEVSDKVKSVREPSMVALITEGVYRRGVCVENVEREVCCYKKLEPLRRAVFCRLLKEGKMSHKVVKDYCCNPNVLENKSQIESWRIPIEFQLDPEKAEIKPPKDTKSLVNWILEFLKTKISYMHLKMLRKQFEERKHLKRPEWARSHNLQRPKPHPDDIHARNLFLQTWEIFCYGHADLGGNVWDIFDGVLFHHLCRPNQKVISQPKSAKRNFSNPPAFRNEHQMQFNRPPMRRNNSNPSHQQQPTWFAHNNRSHQRNRDFRDRDYNQNQRHNARGRQFYNPPPNHQNRQHYPQQRNRGTLSGGRNNFAQSQVHREKPIYLGSKFE